VHHKFQHQNKILLPSYIYRVGHNNPKQKCFHNHSIIIKTRKLTLIHYYYLTYRSYSDAPMGPIKSQVAWTFSFLHLEQFQRLFFFLDIDIFKEFCSVIL
jgi:hypothetical protein